jgi:methylase of polypeptide subunit release factors
MYLPEIGTAAQFAALREFFVRAGYTERRICEKLNLASAEALDIISLSENLAERVAAPDPLSTLVRLFLLGEYVPIMETETQFPGSAWAAMNALGLIEKDSTDRKRCFSSVALYPIQDLFIISDRWTNPDHTPKKSFPDIVYPAMTWSTREFLRFLPADPCGEFLELCGGSGIAALASSRYVRHAWAGDITERSTHFAAFNAALNDTQNVTAVRGDLFSAVEGRTFDRIAAHPPYMPVLRPAEIYYDGGEDGEQLTRRILEGLLQHLNPGGRLYCRTLGTDRKESPFEQRLRGWFGNAESEFDIAVFISKNLDPARFAMDSAVRKAAGQAEVNQWKALFERLQVKEILTGTVVVQRRESMRPVFTIRRSLAPNADSSAIERVLRWETGMAREHSSETVFAARPIASPQVQLIVRHRIEKADFAPQEFTLTSDYPFLMDCQVQPWMGYLVARCDGSRNVQQLYEECREAGWIHQQTPPGEFIGVISLLVSGGFLNVEELKPPAAKE